MEAKESDMSSQRLARPVPWRGKRGIFQMPAGVAGTLPESDGRQGLDPNG
jgi:hypothetical protein